MASSLFSFGAPSSPAKETTDSTSSPSMFQLFPASNPFGSEGKDDLAEKENLHPAPFPIDHRANHDGSSGHAVTTKSFSFHSTPTTAENRPAVKLPLGLPPKPPKPAEQIRGEAVDHAHEEQGRGFPLSSPTPSKPSSNHSIGRPPTRPETAPSNVNAKTSAAPTPNFTFNALPPKPTTPPAYQDSVHASTQPVSTKSSPPAPQFAVPTFNLNLAPPKPPAAPADKNERNKAVSKAATPPTLSAPTFDLNSSPKLQPPSTSLAPSARSHFKEKPTPFATSKGTGEPKSGQSAEDAVVKEIEESMANEMQEDQMTSADWKQTIEQLLNSINQSASTFDELSSTIRGTAEEAELFALQTSAYSAEVAFLAPPSAVDHIEREFSRIEELIKELQPDVEESSLPMAEDPQ